jgi:Holliday junction resolvase
MRRTGKVDANQSEVVAALRKVGASVVSLANCGNGIPDLLVGYRGVNYLIEVKTQAGRLTEDQKEFKKAWNGSSVIVAKTAEFAIYAITNQLEEMRL